MTNQVGRPMNGDRCTYGHIYTRESTYMHKNYKTGKRYRECRICVVDTKLNKTRAERLLWNEEQASIHLTTVTRTAMPECWHCEPSRYTGKRGTLVADEDGDTKCLDCGRGPQVLVSMGVA